MNEGQEELSSGEKPTTGDAVRIISPKEFFESVAPGISSAIARAVQAEMDRFNTLMDIPDIELFCDNEQCKGIRFFTCTSGHESLSSDSPQNYFMTFTCRNCDKSRKLYAIRAKLTDRKGHATFLKLGELPPFGPPTPTKLRKLIQDDYDLFIKGRRCEMQGLGIGAFVYYRRIVENQKHKIFDAIIKVCARLNTDHILVEELEAARKETQFTRAVEVIKHSLPGSLFINGENPLTLLHESLSQGLHGLSDEDCLDLAVLIRTVLAGLAEKMAQVMTDDNELQAAVTKLAQRREAKRLAREAAQTPTPPDP